MLTLKQLADKISKEYNLSISKQAIQYHGDKLEIEYHYNNGVKYLDDEQQQLITNRIKEVHLVNVESDTTINTNVEDKEDANKNTTNESNNDDEYIQHLKDEVVYLRESLKHNQQLLDQQQQLSIHLQNKLDKLNAKPNTNEDNTRSVINSESNQSDNPIEESNSVDNRSIKVKKYKVYSPTESNTNIEDTNTNDQATDTNIDNVKEDKPKGFFARLFNL